ncbi:MAG: hypothetical protein AMXMBFR82_18490 [Candidatus Hydrogenedentota bacterium]
MGCLNKYWIKPLLLWLAIFTFAAALEGIFDAKSASAVPCYEINLAPCPVPIPPCNMNCDLGYACTYIHAYQDVQNVPLPFERPYPGYSGYELADPEVPENWYICARKYKCKKNPDIECETPESHPDCQYCDSPDENTYMCMNAVDYGLVEQLAWVGLGSCSN